MPPTMKRRRSTSPISGGSKKKKNLTSKPSQTKKSPSNNKQWKEWKKQRSHDYNTHQFLDASATVHAGLFGARRLPEIKSLWRQMVQGELSSIANDKQSTTVRQAGESGGGKISSRHLRRRTNSHKPRRYRRFPSGKKDDISEKMNSSDASNQKQKQKKSPCRRARRKPALMKISHSQWWQGTLNNTQMIQTQSPNWIPTHMWHTKRFHMSQLFSWSVPLIHTNRGSRASLRLASSETFPKCTIQDATWEVNGMALKLELTCNDSSTSIQQQYQTLVSILQRLCGTDAPFLNESACSGQIRAGECIIHEIDACPLKPIGPASFIVDYPEESASISILTHPTIHQKISLLLRKILASYNDSNKGNEVIISTLPLALLRIRGRACTTTIRSIFGDALPGDVIDNAEHGTVVNIEPPSSETRILVKCHQPNQNYKHLHLPHNLASSGYDIICHPSICSKLFQSFVTNGGACAIGLTEDVRAQLEAYPPLPIFPRDYPDTEEGKAYWRGDTSKVLNNEGDERQTNTSCKDWAVLRTCIEGSWGRINTPLKRTLRNRKEHDVKESKQERDKKSPATPSDDQSQELQLITKHQVFGRKTAIIHWENLLSPNEESTIVVRGSFGIPFQQLLDGCGRLHAHSESDDKKEDKPKRRPRRRVRPPNSTIQASPLSKDESEAHSNLCRQLRESLSLPAMLRCELFCDGKGSLNVGDLILPICLRNDSDAGISGQDSDCDDSVEDGQSQLSPLGVVVAGGFSPSLGKYHGTGFVGAAKLIDALDGTIHGMGMTIPSNGQRKMALRVKIIQNEASDGCSRFALLSILL